MLMKNKKEVIKHDYMNIYIVTIFLNQNIMHNGV